MSMQRRIDYGVMTSCLVKPALYIVQKTGPRVKLSDQTCSIEDKTGDSDNPDDTGEKVQVTNEYGYCSIITLLLQYCIAEL